jgi:hypothetical protein
MEILQNSKKGFLVCTALKEKRMDKNPPDFLLDSLE